MSKQIGAGGRNGAGRNSHRSRLPGNIPPDILRMSSGSLQSLQHEQSSASKTPLADFLLQAFDMPVPPHNASGRPYCRFTPHDLHYHQLSSANCVHHPPGSRRERRGGEMLSAAVNRWSGRTQITQVSLKLLVKL